MSLGPDKDAPIEFWFDFASGYAYFAAIEIDAIAERHGRKVVWRPITLGPAFKATGSQALSRIPLKADYAWLDWRRLARSKNLPFNPPDNHPLVGLAAIRAFYGVERSDPASAASLAKHVIIGYFQEGLNIDDAHAIGERAAALGLDAASVISAISDDEIKQVARSHSEQALARGVFGSPWIFVDGEPFWGNDRLPMVEQWLATGGW